MFPRNDALRATCREMRSQSLPITQIASKVGVSKQRVWMLVKDMGVRVPTRRELSDSDILAVLKAGLNHSTTIAQIVASTGVGKSSVRNILLGKQYPDKYPEIERFNGRKTYRKATVAPGTLTSKIVAFLADKPDGARFAAICNSLAIRDSNGLGSVLRYGANRGLLRHLGYGLWAATQNTEGDLR